MSAADLFEFIKQGNSVECEDIEERETLLDYLEEAGFEIGFDRVSWLDRDDIRMVGFGVANPDQIHISKEKRTAEAQVIPFSEFSLVSGSDKEISADELPDLSELYW